MNKQKQILGFIALVTAMFMGTLDATITNIALPTITTYFKSGINDTSWISTIYVLSLSVFMITASKLADQFGRKKVMIVGLIIFGLSSALCGFSPSLLFLIIMRFFQGIGGAIITPIVMPMAIELYGKEKTQFVAGAMGAIVALAAASGPPIGGIAIEYLNWQTIFFINVPFAIISFILTIIFVDESYDNTVSKSIDWIGMILLTITLFTLTFGLLKGNDYGWSSALIVSLFVISALSAVLFIVVESKVKAPMIELKLFKESTFTASCICYLVTGFGIASPLLIFNYFLQNVLAYKTLKAAFVVMPASLTVIIAMPLGSLIASKFGARPVNFLGVFIMGIGSFLLAHVNANSSMVIMIIYMIVCGFGMGFSCQSLISSIKYLPKEKCGIGSGIINAARQVGSCIGIAILVSMLNSNVTSAKDMIKNDALRTISTNTNINTNIKTIMSKDNKGIFNNSTKDDSSNNLQNDMQNKMKNDITKAITSLKTVKASKDNSTTAKLYNSISMLNTGAGKMASGINKVGNGLSSVHSGLNKLYAGSGSLCNGLDLLGNGTEKLLDGSKKLESTSGTGINTFFNGADKLNDGMAKIVEQFSTSKSSTSPTIYDGVTGVANGAQHLSASIDKYTSAVNTMLYSIIKNDPISPVLLQSYKQRLLKLKLAYADAGISNKEQKSQYEQQLQALGNVVNIYSAALDSSVTNASDFELKLIKLSQQNADNQTIVSMGRNLTAGSKKLSEASKKVSSQFSDNGTFKNGITKLSLGMNKLSQSRSNFLQMQAGISKISTSISQINAGAKKLYPGAQKLHNGLSVINNASIKLTEGAQKLEESSNKFKSGTQSLFIAVGKLGQKNEISNVMNSIKTNKNKKIANAFDKTFMFSAIILIIMSIFGLFTDRKSSKLKSQAIAIEESNV